jgi:uncharacterized membrane-anchored protein
LLLELVKGEEKLVVFGSGRERLYTRERAKALARKITCELLTELLNDCAYCSDRCRPEKPWLGQATDSPSKPAWEMQFLESQPKAEISHAGTGLISDDASAGLST